jgi:hypothetical protein
MNLFERAIIYVCATAIITALIDSAAHICEIALALFN